MDYPISIFRLPDADGGGYLGVVPDLMGCMSDGETPAEALANTIEAIGEWIETAKRRGMYVPEPGSRLRAEDEYRDQLLAHLKEVRDSVENVETRLDELERAIRDLEERQDHADQWARFAEITNLASPPPAQHTGNC